MGYRLLAALIAVVGLTAFAPAPMPKLPKPLDPAKLLTHIQGEWAIKSTAQTVGGKMQTYTSSPSLRIRITDNTWSQVFTNDGEVLGRRAIIGLNRAGTSFTMALNPLNKPATLDLTYAGSEQVYQQGIVKLEGNTLTFLYTFPARRIFKPGLGAVLDDAPARPTSFDSTEDGIHKMVLERIEAKKDAGKKDAPK